MASSLGIAKGAVTIKRGETSHHKLLLLDVHQKAYEEWLAALPEL